MADRTNFENLRVYQLAESLEDEIWGIVMCWKQTIDELTRTLNGYLRSLEPKDEGRRS